MSNSLRSKPRRAAQFWIAETRAVGVTGHRKNSLRGATLLSPNLKFNVTSVPAAVLRPGRVFCLPALPNVNLNPIPAAPKPSPAAELIAIMRRHKKSQAGKLLFVLPRRLGEVALFDNVPEAEVAAALQSAES
jgi:hypothetical protein